MKHLFIRVIVISAGLGGGLGGIAAADHEKVSLAVNRAHVVAFNKDNIITERLTHKEALEWNNAVKDVGKFIAANAPGLKQQFLQLSRISDNLVNALKIVYGAYIAPALVVGKKAEGTKLQESNFSDLKNINLANIPEIFSPLKKAQSVAINISKTMQKKSPKYSKNFASAKDLLYQLALTLELTINKLFNDFAKIRDLVIKARSQ